jgi:hypothetical protein
MEWRKLDQAYVGTTLRREFCEPGLEDFQLIRRYFSEGDADTHAVLGIDDFPVASKRALVARNAYLNCRSRGQRIQQIHVAALAANFRDSSCDANAAGWLDDFSSCNETVTRYPTSLTIGHMARSRIGQFAESLNILTLESPCAESGTIRFVTPAWRRLVRPEGKR